MLLNVYLKAFKNLTNGVSKTYISWLIKLNLAREPFLHDVWTNSKTIDVLNFLPWICDG